MLDLTALELDTKARETFWALDPAIDLDASDVAEWQRSGDGLVCHEKQRASVIRWRPLTQLEQEAIYTSDVQGFGMLALLVAHGLVGVEGMKLSRERVGIMHRLAAESVARFELLGGEVPGIGQVSPVVWLGGLISQASFRPGG